MSCQLKLRRVMTILGLVLATAAPAAAQVSEPEFVPYVNDVQLFDQPDLSPYGRGVRMPEGWFGSAEYLNWSVMAPKKTLMGNISSTTVWIPGSMTVNTGTPGTLTIANIQVVTSTSSVVTTTANTTQTTTQVVTLTNPTPPPATITGTITTTFTFSVFTTTATFGTPTTQTVPVQITSQFIPSAAAVTVGTFRANSGGQQISMDTGFLASDFTSGGRFEFGRINNGRGWLVSYFNLGTQAETVDLSNVAINFENQPRGFIDVAGPNLGATPTAVQVIGTGLVGYNNLQFVGDGFDDDIDGDGVYGRFGRDRGTRSGSTFSPPLDGIPDPENPAVAPQPQIVVTPDYDDAVPLPTIFRDINIQNRTSLWGVETSRLWRLGDGPRGGQWEFFMGPRLVSVQDKFSVEGSGPRTNPQYYQNPIDETAFSTDVMNNIFGGQLGARWALQRNRWQVAVEMRFIAAANFQNTKQRGYFASNYMKPVIDPTQLGNNITVPRYDDVINAQLPASFSRSASDVFFTPGGEFRFNLKYQMFRSVYMQLGYTGIFLGGVGRGSAMTRYVFPTMGINEQNNHDVFYTQGMNLGVVINR